MELTPNIAPAAESGRPARGPGRLLSYLALILAAGLVLLPLWWVGVSSLTTRETVWANVFPFTWRALLPQEFTLAAYRAIFERGFGQVILNTLGVGLVTTILSLTVGALAGFAFARFDFRGKTLLWALILLSLMVPYEATVIPAYTLVNSLGWTNTWQAIIVPAVANGVVIFIFRQFFAELPGDLIDAARIDGASWPRLFAGVALPLAAPVLVTAAILVFLSQWNAFFWPMLVAPAAEYRLVQVAVSILGVEQQLTFWDLMFASTTLAALVPLVLVLPLQRFYVSSIVGSSVKQ